MRLAAVLAPVLLLGWPALAQEAPQRAPFITTPPEVVARMLAMARTGPEDFVIDLGSGDGRIVIHAAREHGARGLGVDLDAALVARARESAARVAESSLTSFSAFRSVSVRFTVSESAVVGSATRSSSALATARRSRAPCCGRRRRRNRTVPGLRN